MWVELESTHNNQGIVKLENSLTEEKLRLQDLYEYTRGQANIRKEQSKALDKHDQVNEKIKGKASNYQN